MADPIRFALQSLVDAVDGVMPQWRCRCTEAATCEDCAEYGALFEVRLAAGAVLEQAERDDQLAAARAAEPAPPPPCPRCRALTTLVCGSSECPNRVPAAALQAFPVNQSDEE